MWLGSGSKFLDLAGVEAFAFDLDGTLVHSEPVWAAAKTQVAAAHGIAIDAATLERFVGRDLSAFVREALGIADPGRARAMIAEIEDLATQRYGDEVQPIAGAADLVRGLRRAGFRIVICSSASSATIAASLDLLSLSDVIEHSVSAATLPQGKPHKRPYVEVLNRLNLAPLQVIAVEDALPGVESATAAGLRTIAVGAALRDIRLPQCALYAERIGDIRILDQPPDTGPQAPRRGVREI